MSFGGRQRVTSLELDILPGDQPEIDGPQLFYSGDTSTLRYQNEFGSFSSIASENYADTAGYQLVAGFQGRSVYALGTAADTFTPLAPIILVGGSDAINTISLPSGITVGNGAQIVLIPGYGSSWGWGTGGNIPVAGLSVPFQPVIFTWLGNGSTGQWYPSYTGGFESLKCNAIQTAATTFTPTQPVCLVGGSAVISTIVSPFPAVYNAAGRITLVPAFGSTWTWTTGGNIALAGTAVVNRPVDFTWVGNNNAFFPSYV